MFAPINAAGFDLRTLRAVRVLRPLKLVSGIPSKFALLVDTHDRHRSSFPKLKLKLTWTAVCRCLQVSC